VHNEIVKSVDSGDVCALLLLDLSAAFDTVLRNIRSLGNKLDSLLDVRRDKNIDVLFLTETWHDSDSVSIRRLRVELGCQVVGRPRPRARHDTTATNYGGVAAVAFHGVRPTQLDIGVKPATLEFVCMRVVPGTSSCVAAVLYRPGSECVTKMFFTKLRDVTDRLATFTEPIFLVGDLNIRLECPSDPYTRRRPGFVRLRQPGHVGNARLRRSA